MTTPVKFSFLLLLLFFFCHQIEFDVKFWSESMCGTSDGCCQWEINVPQLCTTSSGSQRVLIREQNLTEFWINNLFSVITDRRHSLWRRWCLTLTGTTRWKSATEKQGFFCLCKMDVRRDRNIPAFILISFYPSIWNREKTLKTIIHHIRQSVF